MNKELPTGKKYITEVGDGFIVAIGRQYYGKYPDLLSAIHYRDIYLHLRDLLKHKKPTHQNETSTN